MINVFAPFKLFTFLPQPFMFLILPALSNTIHPLLHEVFTIGLPTALPLATVKALFKLPLIIQRGICRGKNRKYI